MSEAPQPNLRRVTFSQLRNCSMGVYYPQATMLHLSWQSISVGLSLKKEDTTIETYSASALTNSTTTHTMSSTSSNRWTTTQWASSYSTPSSTAPTDLWIRKTFQRLMTWPAWLQFAWPCPSSNESWGPKLLKPEPCGQSKRLYPHPRARSDEASPWPTTCRPWLQHPTLALAAHMKKAQSSPQASKKSSRRFTKRTRIRTTGWTRTDSWESMGSRGSRPESQRQLVRAWRAASRRTGTSSSWSCYRASPWTPDGKNPNNSSTGPSSGDSWWRLFPKWASTDLPRFTTASQVKQSAPNTTTEKFNEKKIKASQLSSLVPYFQYLLLWVRII